jgi:hypothetical protein
MTEVMMAPKFNDVLVREEYKEYELSLQDLANVVNRFLALDRGAYELYGDDYYGSSSCSLIFTGYRKETETERLTRLAIAKGQREARKAEQTKVEEAQRAMLRKLAKQFPDELENLDDE